MSNKKLDSGENREKQRKYALKSYLTLFILICCNSVWNKRCERLDKTAIKLQKTPIFAVKLVFDEQDNKIGEEWE